MPYNVKQNFQQPRNRRLILESSKYRASMLGIAAIVGFSPAAVICIRPPSANTELLLSLRASLAEFESVKSKNPEERGLKFAFLPVKQ